MAHVCDVSAFFSETTDADDSVWLADFDESMRMTYNHERFREPEPPKMACFPQIASDTLLKVAKVSVWQML